MFTLFQSQLFPAKKSKEPVRQLVVILGGSLLMDGVEAGLKAISTFDVIHAPDGLSDPVQYLKALSPDIILFDWDCSSQNIILSYIRQNPETLIFGLDLFSQKITHLSGQLHSISSSNGLLWLIEQESKTIASSAENNHHLQFDDNIEELLQTYTQVH
jgi:hypothetical protein